MKFWLLGVVVSFSLGFFSEPQMETASKMTDSSVLEPFHLFFFGFTLLCFAECLRKLGNLPAAWHRAMLYFQHAFNPLHVYCYLVKKGWKKTISITICKGYERFLYRWATRLTLILDVQEKHSK